MLIGMYIKKDWTQDLRKVHTGSQLINSVFIEVVFGVTSLP